MCSDLWKPYLKVVAERTGQAVHVLDRFPIMSHFSKAIDEVRAAEARKLAAEGRAPVLKRSRWLLLKRPENLTDAQSERVAERVRRNLRTVRAWLLKEDFQGGRVDDWRGGVRSVVVAVSRRLSQYRCLAPRHRSVSSRRSSNRTCGSPASGSRSRS